MFISLADLLPTRQPILMAILNITPDSFSDGGRFSQHNMDALLIEAERLLAAGAHILDIGGESTRPGAHPIPIAEECQRVIPVVKALHRHFQNVPLSIDTRKAAVAKAAIQAGASIINDISGIQYDGAAMAQVAAETGAYLIIMHSQGTPETMQQNPTYTDLLNDLLTFFRIQTQLALSHGVSPSKIILDPGFGFGKTLSHNLTLLNHLDHFLPLGYPILVGTSRKSFLTLGQPIPPQEREALTAASLVFAFQHGASLFRLHDPLAHAPVLHLITAVCNA